MWKAGALFRNCRMPVLAPEAAPAAGQSEAADWSERSTLEGGPFRYGCAFAHRGRRTADSHDYAPADPRVSLHRRAEHDVRRLRYAAGRQFPGYYCGAD